MDKEFFKDEGIIAPLLEHIKKRELMLFLPLVKSELIYDNTGMKQSQFEQIVKLTHFGTNKLIGEYLEDEPVQMETLVLYCKKEREQELKDLAVGIGKKFGLASAMFIYPDGKTVYIKTTDDGGPARIGTEIKEVSFINVDIIEQFYSLREEGGFALKSVGDKVEPLYGSWMNAMLCDAWHKCYKKYGANALEVWASRCTTNRS